MKTLEKVLWVIVAGGVLLEVGHLPLSGFLLIIGLSALALLYFSRAKSAFRTATRTIPIGYLRAFGGTALSIALIGILFKVQMWPMSSFYLLIGGIGILGFLIASRVMRTDDGTEGSDTRGLQYRAIPILAVIIILYTLPRGTLIRYYYRDDTEMERLLIQQDTTTDPSEKARLQVEVDSLFQARARQ